jgi:hypothetical protein
MTPLELIDEIQEAKNLLKDLGRRVFRISSSMIELNEEDQYFLRSFSDEHQLFDNESVIHKHLDEFYKASEGYVELLRDINIRLLEISGRPRSDPEV